MRSGADLMCANLEQSSTNNEGVIDVQGGTAAERRSFDPHTKTGGAPYKNPRDSAVVYVCVPSRRDESNQ